jgi:uncharacterized protein (DUF302 family)
MTIIAPPGNVIAVETAMGFNQILESLRVELPRQAFRILTEVDFSRELDSQIGLSTSRYVVLIVWHAFSAYQALLSDPNGGLMIPFNLAVRQHGCVTTVSVLVQPSLAPEASLGIRVLGQDLNRQMRDVMLHVGAHERQSSQGGQSHAATARR